MDKNLEENFDESWMFEVLLRHNTPSCQLTYNAKRFTLKQIQNDTTQSFGSNHNSNFNLVDSDIFVVCNPDVILLEGSFQKLIKTAFNTNRLISPFFKENQGEVFDPGREKPRMSELISRFVRLFLWKKKIRPRSEGDPLDWVPGVFMVFPSQVYRTVKGFDERIFMYYEDADICRRLNLIEVTIQTTRDLVVFHHVGRASRFSARLLFHHLSNAIRVSFLRQWKRLE